MKKMTEEEILETMVEIEPLNQDQFFLVRETLTRVGVPSRKGVKEGNKPTLYQSIHVFHKKGRYYLTHFKQLFLLDGRFEKTEITDEDIDRLFLVAKLLLEWNLIKPLHDIPQVENALKLTIISYKEKHEWNLESKHSIGKKR